MMSLTIRSIMAGLLMAAVAVWGIPAGAWAESGDPEDHHGVAEVEANEHGPENVELGGEAGHEGAGHEAGEHGAEAEGGHGGDSGSGR